MEFVVYQIRCVAQVLFEQLMSERVVYVSSIYCKNVKGAFIDRFFTFEMREKNILESVKILQGNMSVNEYVIKFTKFSMFSSTMVVDFMERMSNLCWVCLT